MTGPPGSCSPEGTVKADSLGDPGRLGYQGLPGRETETKAEVARDTFRFLPASPPFLTEEGGGQVTRHRGGGGRGTVGQVFAKTLCWGKRTHLRGQSASKTPTAGPPSSLLLGGLLLRALLPSFWGRILPEASTRPPEQRMLLSPQQRSLERSLPRGHRWFRVAPRRTQFTQRYLFVQFMASDLGFPFLLVFGCSPYE